MQVGAPQPGPVMHGAPVEPRAVCHWLRCTTELKDSLELQADMLCFRAGQSVATWQVVNAHMAAGASLGCPCSDAAHQCPQDAPVMGTHAAQPLQDDGAGKTDQLCCQSWLLNDRMLPASGGLPEHAPIVEPGRGGEGHVSCHSHRDLQRQPSRCSSRACSPGSMS